MGWVFNATSRLLFPWERDLVPILQEAGWAPGLVWAGAENRTPTEIRFPDPAAPSASLYQLSYPGLHYDNNNNHHLRYYNNIIITKNLIIM